MEQWITIKRESINSIKKLSNDVNRLIPLATQLENVRIEMMQHYGRA